LGQEYQLLDWLSNVTFPREKMFADERYATAVYEEVVKRTLSVGVTTAAYYASLHERASRVLADTTLRIGKCERMPALFKALIDIKRFGQVNEH
jgi:guanine deaminase